MSFAALGKHQHSFWYAKLEDPSFVYIAQSTRDQPFKVGVAKGVLSRLGALQTGHPYKLRVMQVAPGGVELERELHHMLRGSRLYGEWFEAEAADKFFPFFSRVEKALKEGWDVNAGVPDFRVVHPGPWREKPAKEKEATGLTVIYSEPDPVMPVAQARYERFIRWHA